MSIRVNKYTPEELIHILYGKIVSEVNKAFNENKVDDLIKKYGLEETEEYCYFNVSTSKILVLGDLACDKNILLGKAKSLGIEKNQIEFGPDYSKMTNFDFSKLRNSMEYSDVLVGPIPHKGKNIGDFSSFLAMAENLKSEFPKIIRLEDSNGLKVTKSSFSKGIQETRLYNEFR